MRSEIFQLQSTLNAIRCINQRLRSRILVFRVWLGYSTWTIWEGQSCMQGLQLAKYNEWCTVFQTADMNPWLSIVRRLGFHSSSVLKFSAAPWPFCVALSPSVHWHASFLYCCALYNFFFLGFRQWRSRADRVVNLNTTIQLALFWRTWTRALASTRPHVLAWHVGRDYSYCGALELTGRQVRGFVFSWYGVHRSNTSTMQFVQNNLGHFSKDLLLSRIQVTN